MGKFSIKTVMRQLGAKKVLERALGPGAYYAIRSRGLKVEAKLNRLQNSLGQKADNRRISIDASNSLMKKGVLWSLVTDMTLTQAIEANLLLVKRALDEAGVGWWLVDDTPVRPVVIGVDAVDRGRCLTALGAIGPKAPIYATYQGGPILRQISRITDIPDFEASGVISVLEPRIVAGSSLSYGPGSACQIEFWEFDEDHAVAPRENRASRYLSKDDFTLMPTTLFGFAAQAPSALKDIMLDDVAFPVDAVYTWVNGDDPAWLESKKRTEAEISGVEYHNEANHMARFRSRDELKYSLRSLDMFAPWFRNIYVVTAGQIPDWLNVDHPRIKMIDHSEIYPDASYLPTFNSNSIISRLHHIEGLSEHYVYINDDVFFGRPLTKDRFFLPSGIAKVTRSNNRRPFGKASASDGPHLNLTRNIRAVLKEEFGITISRAIKHTPHPQLRSVHLEMESRFSDLYEKTWTSRFRHHDDLVADQLHHYYAQIVGKAVPAGLRYNYVNVLDDRYREVLQSTLRWRHRDSFCINDAPVDDATAIPDEEVGAFLEQYFPVKSSFEK